MREKIAKGDNKRWKQKPTNHKIRKICTESDNFENVKRGNKIQKFKIEIYCLSENVKNVN